MKASVAIKIFLSLALGLLTYSEVVRAADAQIDCSDPKGRYEIDACVTSERDKIEGELSGAYEQTLNEVDKQVAADPQRLVGLKSQFIKAQQAWNVFRENECEAIQIWYTNGSLQYNLYTECMIQHAKVRIETIRKFSVDYIH